MYFLKKTLIRHFIAVSYTHLDVYKRQSFSSTAKVECGLKCLDEKNIQSLQKIISGIKVNYGTSIPSGLNEAFKILMNRK